MTECILGMNDESTYITTKEWTRNCLTKLFKTTNFDKFLTHLSSLTKSTPTETGGAAMLLFMTGAKFRKINLIAIAPTCTQLLKDSFSVNFVNYIQTTETWNKNLLCLSWQTHSLVLYAIMVIISLSYQVPDKPEANTALSLYPPLHNSAPLYLSPTLPILDRTELSLEVSTAVGKYDVTVPVSNGCNSMISKSTSLLDF